MKLKIGIVIAVVVILAAGAFLLKGKGTQQSSDSSGSKTTQEQKAVTETKSLKDLLSGPVQECRFSVEGVKGTVRVANQKMRTDMVTTEEGKEMTTHMITDGKNSYFWIEGEGSGYKMAFDVNEKATEIETTQKAVDLDHTYDYSCTPWTTDSTSFELPANVVFTDLSAIAIPSMAAKPKAVSGDTNTDLQCSACDSAPESYRAQCKQALGCK